MSKIKKQDILLCSITGIIYPLTFMIPYIGIVSFILLIPFFISLQNKNPWNSFKLGTLTGTLVNLIGTYWLIETLTRFGGFPTPISFILIVFLSIYSGFQIGLFALITSKFQLFNKKGILPALVIASIWTSLEYLFPLLFPYGIANTVSNYLPLIQAFDLFGIYFLSFIIVLVNVTVYKVFSSYKTREFQIPEIAVTVVLITLVLIYGIYKINYEEKKIAEAQKLKVGLVQANFDFFEKNENLEPIVTKKHQEMSKELEDVDLIIWPETAIQVFFPTSTTHLEYEGEISIPNIMDKYFLVGAMSYHAKDGDYENLTQSNLIQYNTAYFTNSNGEILGRYHKIKLLLFGEYLPFSNYFPILKQLSPASGDFTPGNEFDLFEIKEKGVKIAPIICYEDIIPWFSRKFVNNGANLIINITNDAWFGRTVAPYQHLFISIPRAIETRKYLIRSTNTGISAIIDPVGRVIVETNTFEETNLVSDVGIMDGEKTLYTRIGDVFPISCSLFWIGYLVVIKLRRNNIRQG